MANDLAAKHINSYCRLLVLLLREYSRSHEDEKYRVVIRDLVRASVRGAANQVSHFEKSKGKVSAQFASVEALKQLEEGSGVGLVFEHVIPVSVLSKEILDKATEWKSHLELEQYFQKYAITAIVTASEDRKLNLNYRNKMPEGWAIERPFARYDNLGISYVPRDQSMYEKHRHLLAGKKQHHLNSTRSDAGCSDS